jgi:LacI family transcriptional regulator
VSTASRALDPARSWRISDATVLRVRRMSEQLGYTPDFAARGLKSGTSSTIGVVVSSLEEPFIGLVVRGVMESLEENQLVALVTETREDSDRLAALVNLLVSRRVDAIITTAAQETDGRLLQLAADAGTPVVLAVRTVQRFALPSVVGDDAHGVGLALDHLAALGHRTCAQLRGPAGVSSFAVRARVFERRLGELGIVDVSLPESAAAVTIDEGRRLMETTLARSHPTGVFAHTDLLAVGAVEAIRAAGLDCPRDISVVGYNDVPLAEYLTPPLSTVRIPAVDVGRRAAALALELIADPLAKPARATFAPELVIRGSSGPAPG